MVLKNEVNMESIQMLIVNYIGASAGIDYIYVYSCTLSRLSLYPTSRHLCGMKEISL